MKISDDKTLRELQEEFQNLFPYLKLEFFPLPSSNLPKSIAKKPLATESFIGEARSFHNRGSINLDPELSASALEQIFLDIFGLNTRVYRKSSGKWVLITSGDLLTLKEQNLRSLLSGARAMII